MPDLCRLEGAGPLYCVTVGGIIPPANTFPRPKTGLKKSAIYDPREFPSKDKEIYEY